MNRNMGTIKVASPSFQESSQNAVGRASMMGIPSTQFSRPTFLMCSPEWYEVRYVINPWMAGNIRRSNRDTAFEQWKGLYTTLKDIGDVRLLQSRPNSPDMTFIAHGALINYGLAALSSFTNPERKPEEVHLRRWLEDAGFLPWQARHGISFEGEGDAMFSPEGDRLWVAHGPRTSPLSHQHLARGWQVEVSSLRLVDPRFFHLDTCFAPLHGGYVLYFPGAFDTSSLQKIESAYPRPSDRHFRGGGRPVRMQRNQCRSRRHSPCRSIKQRPKSIATCWL